VSDPALTEVFFEQTRRNFFELTGQKIEKVCFFVENFPDPVQNFLTTYFCADRLCLLVQALAQWDDKKVN